MKRNLVISLLLIAVLLFMTGRRYKPIAPPPLLDQPRIAVPVAGSISLWTIIADRRAPLRLR